MKNRLWSILLVLCMILTLLPFGAVPASAADVSDLTYEIKNDEVEITDCREDASGALTIPAAINGYPVTSIGSQAFAKCSSLTSVTIPNSVTSIGVDGFFNSGLTTIMIPESVTSIGAGSFSACKSLPAIQVDESNPSYCSVDGVLLSKDLKTLVCYPAGKAGAYVIPDSVTVIESAAFSGCTGLTDVKIPNGVTDIYSNTFYGCTGLSSIVIPESVTGFYWLAFGGCENLTDVTLTPTQNELIIPSEVFEGTSITDIWYTGTKEQWAAHDGDPNEYEGLTVHYNSHLHTLTAVAAAAPTCTEDGAAAYWRCEDCGKLFSDIWEKNEIAAPTVIPATGHSWNDGEITKEPTETAEGVKTFTCTVCGETRTEAIEKLSPAPTTQPAANPFSDIAKNQYYYEPVLWAVNHDPQITAGTSATTFSPDASCTRGQIVTFLWRANGQPEPTIKKNPFTDVKPSDYFYKAVLWAVEKEITAGTSATTFSPAATVTRAQTVTFLWRAEGKPAATAKNPFTDVPAGQYYTDAVLWAVKNEITAGTSATTFSPNNPCTRGQIVTFLWRDLAE